MTECFIVGHREEAVATLKALRDLGVMIAADNFWSRTFVVVLLQLPVVAGMITCSVDRCRHLISNSAAKITESLHPGSSVPRI